MSWFSTCSKSELVSSHSLSSDRDSSHEADGTSFEVVGGSLNGKGCNASSDEGTRNDVALCEENLNFFGVGDRNGYVDFLLDDGDLSNLAGEGSVEGVEGRNVFFPVVLSGEKNLNFFGVSDRNGFVDFLLDDSDLNNLAGGESSKGVEGDNPFSLLPCVERKISISLLLVIGMEIYLAVCMSFWISCASIAKGVVKMWKVATP